MPEDGAPGEAVDPALVFERATAGPGTHVLLVGIGNYDHLLDGEAEDADLAEGMEQLDAPPHSVRAIATWFLDGNFRNDERPLASLAMVVSAPDPFVMEHAAAVNGGKPVPAGSADDVQDAIRLWLKRASSDRGNQTIFYFCGHGAFTGNQVLLCRDYGRQEDDRFDGALNFSAFCARMSTKTPDYQIFFADACRTPDTITDMIAEDATAGRTPISGSKLADRGGAMAKQSVHFASSQLTPSFGRVDGASIYADALLRALSGGGATSDLEMWVGTDGLQTALGTYTARIARVHGVEQEPDRTRSGRFRIHRPEKIEVPVYLTCDPAEALRCKFTLKASRDAGAEVSIEHDPAVRPDQVELEFTLAYDKYNLAATFDAAAPFVRGEASLIVQPPEAPVCLPIERRNDV